VSLEACGAHEALDFLHTEPAVVGNPQGHAATEDIEVEILLGHTGAQGGSEECDLLGAIQALYLEAQNTNRSLSIGVLATGARVGLRHDPARSR
jgi:hypothetical protein